MQNNESMRIRQLDDTIDTVPFHIVSLFPHIYIRARVRVENGSKELMDRAGAGGERVCWGLYGWGYNRHRPNMPFYSPLY